MADVSRALTFEQKAPGGNLAHREPAKEIGKRKVYLLCPEKLIDKDRLLPGGVIGKER